jgi:hypothetical protein
MPVVTGKASKGSGESQGKMTLVIVIVVLAIAAAVFSITRTVRQSQGVNKGSLGGFSSKAELMKGQGVEPPPGQAGSGREGPVGSGMEGPPGSAPQGPSGPMFGGKGSGK